MGPLRRRRRLGHRQASPRGRRSHRRKHPSYRLGLPDARLDAVSLAVCRTDDPFQFGERLLVDGLDQLNPSNSPARPVAHPSRQAGGCHPREMMGLQAVEKNCLSIGCISIICSLPMASYIWMMMPTASKTPVPLALPTVPIISTTAASAPPPHPL